jgi:hypothetical protein
MLAPPGGGLLDLLQCVGKDLDTGAHRIARTRARTSSFV